MTRGANFTQNSEICALVGEACWKPGDDMLVGKPCARVGVRVERALIGHLLPPLMCNCVNCFPLL